MKDQALFSSKDKSKKLKCCLLQFLFGALRLILSQASLFLRLVMDSYAQPFGKKEKEKFF